MKLMRKLLTSLGDVWNTLPKEIAFLTIRKGTGTHNMVTIDRGTLNFHSVPFRSGLPTKQEIILDGLTTAELLATINGMGYVASLTSEAIAKGLDVHKPFVMMEVENVPLDATLNAFTSKLWKRLYPIYRTLRQAEMDIDLALKMLYVDMASGDWLDFWADFFSIKREPGESDNDFIRRFLTWLFNPKTNNIALKELLAYRLKDNNIDVKDKAPSEFEVLVGVKYLYDSVALHKILSEAKTAGVEYFLNYVVDPYSEDYRIYAADANGKPFENLDTLAATVLKSLAEEVPKPTETGRTAAVTKTLTETFPAPSEAEAPTSGVVKSLVESTWVKPVENLTTALNVVLNENYPIPSEVRTAVLQKIQEETYEGFSAARQTNIDGCFTLNASEILGFDGELYDTNGLPKCNDIATVTLTDSNGEIVRSYSV